MCVYTHGQSQAAPGPVDPGVRGGAPGAGTLLDGLTADETAFFQHGLAKFLDIESVTGGQSNGLRPRFNSNQCLSASKIVERFNRLSTKQQQDLINFLRSL
jgi:hypothetical protein